MFTQYPNQATLPYSPDQVQLPFMHGIGPQNPPFVPPPGTIQGHPQILQFVPVIAGWAASEIQNTAESNHLRRFFFNMFGQRQFANDDFVALVQAVVDFLEVQWAQNPGLQPQQLLEKSIMQTVEMLVSVQTRLWPMLGNYVAPQQRYGVDQQLATFDQVKMAIGQLRGRQQQVVQPAWGVQQSTMGRVDPRLGGGVSLTGAQPSLFSNAQPMAAVAGGQGESMNSGRWAGKQLVSDHTPAIPVVRVGQQQPNQNTVHVAGAPTQTVQVETNMNDNIPLETPQQHGALEPIYSTSLRFTPNPKQPYFPAYNPDVHGMFLQKLADGTVIVQIKDLNKTQMDYEKHKIVSAFGPTYRPVNVNAVQEKVDAIRAGLANIETEKKARQTEAQDAPAFPTHVNPMFAVDLMEELIWTRVACNWLDSSIDGKRADIYRRYGYVVELVVGEKSEDHFIETLRETRGWEALWKAFTDMKSDMSVQLWTRINVRLTELVNRVLSFNLSLVDLSIDSFAGDLPELVTVLKDSYGDVIFNAFKRNENYLIHSVFELVAEDDAVDELEHLFIPQEDPNAEKDPTKFKPVFTHLIKAASFTFLNCLSHELRVELTYKEGTLLTQSLTPVLYDIAKGIITETNDIEDTTFAHHYIQTLDGKILEIDTGFLGDEVVIVRLVK